MADTFKPLDLIGIILRRWWLIVISMIVFGIFALVLSNFISPLYEASAVYSVTIDYTETGALSDIQEDQAMKGVGNLIDSDEVIEKTLDTLNKHSLQITRDQFEKGSTLDREEFQWTIRYRSSDPILSKDIIQTWMEISDTLIKESLIHAQVVDTEREYLWNLEECLQYATGQSSANQICGFLSIKELIDQISNVSKSINEEKTAARGLFSPISVQIVKKPVVSHHPVRHQRNLLVFGGMVSGLLIMVLFQGISYFRSFRNDP
jgi:uncharacterized protein involved in exopolysaccharide biosynthesis